MSDKKKKGFWRSYIQSIGLIIIYLAFIAYPYFAMQFNPPPLESSTQILRGEIVNAQRQFPHVLLKLRDGTEQYLSFPGSLQTVYAAKYPDFYGASKEDLALLNGCDVEVRVDHIKGLVVPSSPRIWSIQCKKFSLSYDKLSKYYLEASKFGGTQWFVFGSCLFLLVLSIRTDSILRSRS